MDPNTEQQGQQGLDPMAEVKKIMENPNYQPPTMQASAPVAENSSQGNDNSGGSNPEATANPDELFSQRLVEATGGQLNNLEDFNQFWGKANNYEALQAELNQLRAKTQMSPFANEMVGTINDFFQKGGTMEEYYRLMDMQKIDPEQVQDLDAIRQQYRHQYPKMTSNQIDLLIKKDIGNFEGEKDEDTGQAVVDPMVTAEISRKGDQARAWIREQKQKLGTPEAAIRNQTEQAQVEGYKSAWKDLSTFALQGMDSISIPVEGFEGLNFPIPEEFKQDLVQAVSAYAFQAQQSGQIPISSDKYESTIKPQLQEWAQRVVWMAHGPKIAEALAKHAVAQATKRAKLDASGLPPRSSQQQQPVEVNEESKKAFNEFKRQMAGFN